MITVRELSEKLGVSKQAVYNRITKEPLQSQLAAVKDAIVKNSQGVIYISSEGADIITATYADRYEYPGSETMQGGYGRLNKKSAKDNEKFEALASQMDQLNDNIEALRTLFQEYDTNINKKIEKLVSSIQTQGDMQGRIKMLNDFIEAKDARIQSIQDRYTEAVGQAKIFRMQAVSLKEQLDRLASGEEITPGKEGDAKAEPIESSPDTEAVKPTEHEISHSNITPATDPIEQYGRQAYTEKRLLQEDDDLDLYSAEERLDIMQGIYDSINKLVN